MNYIKQLACVGLLLFLVDLSQAQGWRGLVPLHSTRADVERLLGTPKQSRGLSSTFDTKDEQISVSYSDGQCKKGATNDWDVPRDTLLTITVHPNAKLLVEDLKLDKMKYDRVLDYHSQNVIYYFSKEDGVRISSRLFEREREHVDNITYEPAERDVYLRCPGSSDQRTDRKEYRKFDEYSDITAEDEKTRLDDFATYLQKEPQFKGYIIYYSGRDKRFSNAKARAECAKDYLVTVRSINAARIITIGGGRRNRLEIELYALPSSMSPPAPNAHRNE